MSPKPTCGACRFYVANESPSSPQFGRCKRWPPTGFFSDLAEVSAHPMVEASNWCGEFSRATLREFMQPGKQPATGVILTDAAAAGAVPALDKLRGDARRFGEPDPIAQRMAELDAMYVSRVRELIQQINKPREVSAD